MRQNSKKETAESERLLLETYDVRLPDKVAPSPFAPEDRISVAILRRFHPATLEEFRPLTTYGDGNCFYRSVSLGMYGSENYHLHLRLLTAIEIVANRSIYDIQATNYRDVMNDNRVIVSDYPDLVDSACTLHNFSEMMHMYATSAALQVPLRSYYPPFVSSQCHSQPFSRMIVGHSVKSSEPPVTLMWTHTIEPKVASQFKPNHFVPMIRRQEPEPVFVNVESPSNYSRVSSSPSPSPLRYSSLSSTPPSSRCQSPSSSPAPHQSSDTPVCSLPHVRFHSDIPDDERNNSSLQDPCDRESDVDESEGKLHHNKFLDVASAIKLLNDNDVVPRPRVPAGKKENEFFIVDNKSNVERRSKGQKSAYWDDCGIWETKSGTSPKQFFVQTANHFASVFLRNGLYCVEKQIQKKRTYVPIEPQPSNVLVVHRCYASLKKDPSYRKRVTWIEGRSDRAIYEYIGKFPGRQDHGNNKTTTRDFIRTPAETLKKIGQEAKHQYPSNVYDDLAANSSITGPRDVKQIRNKKHTDKKKNLPTSGNILNFADNIQVVENIVHSNPFVQQVINFKSKVPSVICYLPDQIQDMSRFCAVPDGAVLGFDKTFNLADIHVTVAVFKHKAVRKYDSGSSYFFRPFLFSWKF